jgi:hypothetical protein
VWPVIIVAAVLWVLCGAPVPDPPTRDPKKRLKRQARKRLCYGEIATIERDVYGRIWTDPKTGAVHASARLDGGLMTCDIWTCNAHGDR